MQLSVQGQHIDVGSALREHIRETLEHMLSKNFGDAIDARVTLSRESNRYTARLSAHVGRNIRLEAEGEALEPYPAFDQAAERLAKRLRRHKSRLNRHGKQGPSGAAETLIAPSYVLAAEQPEAEAEANDQPLIVAEMTTEIPTLSVSEAVMIMDLADTPAMMFRNVAHGGLNMIYRRTDGNIGWVDPSGNKA